MKNLKIMIRLAIAGYLLLNLSFYLDLDAPRIPASFLYDADEPTRPQLLNKSAHYYPTAPWPCSLYSISQA